MLSIDDKLYYITINYLPIFILIVLVIDRLKQASKKNIYTACFTYFIGTFLHELSHLVVSFITNGKPTSFSLIPKKDVNNPNYITLGYVINSNIKWYNAIPIALSPILLLIIAYFFDRYFYKYISQNIYSLFLYLFLLINLLDSSIPSKNDFKIAISSLFGLMFYIVIASGTIFYFYKGF